MKILALAILTIITLRQAVRAMIIKRDRELDKLAYVLLPTIVFYLILMRVI